MSAPRRIALIRLSHLGDVVLALPVFHALRARFPGAEIAWVVQSEFAGLVEGLPGPACALRFERRGGARAWLALRGELARFDPDLAVDAQSNVKSAIAVLCTGAARRVGLARADWRERAGAWVLNERVAAVAGSESHAMDRMRALCQHFAPGAALRIDPDLSAGERDRGRAELERLLGRRASAPAIVGVSRASDVRSWPLARVEALALRLAAEGRDVLAVSGPGEIAEGTELAARTDGEARVRHWVGQRGLRELAALFAAAAESGGTYVGSDSGPMHLAAACSLPVVLLSGPQSHLRTGPWPIARDAFDAPGASPHRVVRAPQAPECAPCFQRACTHARGPVCMQDIDVDPVLCALRPGSAPR